MATVRTSIFAALVVLSPATALAQTVEEAQAAQLEELRRSIANEIQLAAFNLVDELVYGWTTNPLFQQPTDIAVAGVTVPVGLGTALAGLVENHLGAVLLKNPSTKMVLTHCPACTAVIVHSGPTGTIVSRGVDNPDALARLRRNTQTRHALFVDIEAEGTWLVLRARITKLDESLSVVWARTISSAAGAPSMLREPDDIKSVEEARRELTDAIADQWPITVPAKISVRLYDAGQRAGGVIPPPFVWFMSGVELALSSERAWTANFTLGYGYVPSSFDGFMAQVRIHRLLTGTSRSYTRPDLYLFVGAAVMAVNGPSAAIFARDQLTTEDVIMMTEGELVEPTQVFTGLHTGLELRFGNRLGLTVYLETLPSHWNSESTLGTIVAPFHSIGTEVGVWF